MLTPIFDITQDHKYLYISISAPHARIADTEIEFEDCEFRFYSKPYFLRLSLPGKVIEDGSESANYDYDKGMFVIQVPKQSDGEHFEGLDMITKLLAPMGHRRAAPPLIEVIDNDETINNSLSDDDDNNEYDWHIEQRVWSESNERALTGEKYGFANQQSGVFARLDEDLIDTIDLKDPEHKTHSDRRKERIDAEIQQFNDDHYLSDAFDQKEAIESVLNYEAEWDKIDNAESVPPFSIDEKYKLKNLPNKEYIHDKQTDQSLLLGLLDILYAYAYDIRTNDGEHSVESSWTICKLSATLSWFESFTSLSDVIKCSVRRSLCYPLYRHWELSLKVLKDTQKIIKLGRSYALKCLLDIHTLFNVSGDSRYILNDLYITDYCVWIQHIKESAFDSLSAAIDKVSLSKKDMNLDLDILEKAAFMAIEEKTKHADSCMTMAIENLITDPMTDKMSQNDHVSGAVQENVIVIDESANETDENGLYHETTSGSSTTTSDTSSYTTTDESQSESDDDDCPTTQSENSSDINDSDDSSLSDSDDLPNNVTRVNTDLEMGRRR